MKTSPNGLRISDAAKTKRRRAALRKILLPAIGTGLVFAPGAFVFTIFEAWMASYTIVPKTLFLWLVPTFATVCYALAVAVVFEAISRSKGEKEREPEPRFREATLAYASSLAQAQRDSALLELQGNVGWVFHSLSANQERIDLGQLAVEAALRLGDVARQVAILIDDIGWANHMAGNDSEALANVGRAITIIDKIPADEQTSDLLLQRAKAYRHWAIIEAPKGEGHYLPSIKAAEQDVIGAVPAGAERETETAQIRHAEALCASISLGLADGRRIRPDDQEGYRVAVHALALTRDAKARFTIPGRWQFTRYTKALYLEHVLLLSLGREAEAHETMVMLDDALGRSAWSIEPANRNVRGL